MNIRGMLNAAKKFTIKHGPEILTAIGTIGLVASGIMAVNQTPRAIEILEQHKDEIGELTPQEKIKACWKTYLPSVLMATSSISCIIFARRIDAKRMAAWAAAYQMSESALLRLEDSVKKEFGENKLQKVKDEADLSIIDENPIDPSDIYNTGDGDDLFVDYYSGHAFRSSPQAVKTYYNHFISELLLKDTLSVNDWLSEIGLKPLADEVGGALGWNAPMYQCRDLWDEPIFEYRRGPLDKAIILVKMSTEPKSDYAYNY